MFQVVTISSTLTARDIERDRGRQLTKYERNMMIFNWLQTLEDSSYDIMTWINNEKKDESQGAKNVHLKMYT